MTPQISGEILLIPRVTHWPEHGWRAEVVIDDDAVGDIVISEFVATREGARRLAIDAGAEAAKRYLPR
jgi:hypothetical protein